MKVKYQSKKTGEWLCFKHAAKRALEMNEDIEPECDEDDFCSDYDFRNTTCADCSKETEADGPDWDL